MLGAARVRPLRNGLRHDAVVTVTAAPRPARRPSARCRAPAAGALPGRDAPRGPSRPPAAPPRTPESSGTRHHPRGSGDANERCSSREGPVGRPRSRWETTATRDTTPVAAVLSRRGYRIDPAARTWPARCWRYGRTSGGYGSVEPSRRPADRSTRPGALCGGGGVETKAYLSSREALQMRESDLERELNRRGQELMRKLLQGHLDQRSPGEAAGPVEGADGVERSERRLHDRQLETTFGTVAVERLGYAHPGHDSLHPLDASLNLPAERYSLDAAGWPKRPHRGRSTKRCSSCLAIAGPRCPSVRRNSWSLARPRTSTRLLRGAPSGGGRAGP